MIKNEWEELCRRKGFLIKISTLNVLQIDSWIKRVYGSRRGFVRTMWHRLLNLLGQYQQYKDIDWSEVNRLVFVCKGNICRSAFAEAVAGSLGIDCISCGLDTIEDAPANVTAQKLAKFKGFDLSNHKTQPVMYIALKKTDLLIAMEPWQANFLNCHLKRDYQCTLLGLWGERVLPYIHDPYSASDAYFDNCFSYIQVSVESLIKKMPK